MRADVVAVDNNNEMELVEEEVAQFLKNNPGFFLRREDLLCDMDLSHPSGGAISLMERQVSLLRERNMDIRSRLSNLLDNARNNDALFDKTKQLILSLLEAKTLDKLVSTLQTGLLNDFAMDNASIILFGEAKLLPQVSTTVVSLDQAYQQIPALLKSNNASCGVLRPEELKFLFANNAEQVGSAAVVALNDGHHLGVLAIGSHDSHYFRSSMGTLFLVYIAEVLNRILPDFLEVQG